MSPLSGDGLQPIDPSIASKDIATVERIDLPPSEIFCAILYGKLTKIIKGQGCCCQSLISAMFFSCVFGRGN
jgi:hypothetical protein